MRYPKVEHSTIEIMQLSDGKPIHIFLNETQKLGEGSFGSTYFIEHPQQPSKALVCKVIRLEN